MTKHNDILKANGRDVWVPVTEKLFRMFCRENFLMIFSNKKEYQYWGNASRKGWAMSKYNNTEFYIKEYALFSWKPELKAFDAYLEAKGL